MGRFGKNGLRKRSAWQFRQPEPRTAPLQYIPHTLAWEYVEAELPFIIFISSEKEGTFTQMTNWCNDQFGEVLLSEQQPSKRADKFMLRLQHKIVTTKQFGTRDRPNRMFSVTTGGLWQGWNSLNPAIIELYKDTFPPMHGTFWFFRSESQCIVFKLRWY
jgi:hypothetical protein